MNNKSITKRDILIWLTDVQGWSDLIDSRWKDKLVAEIRENFPDITEELLNDILNVVLV